MKPFVDNSAMLARAAELVDELVKTRGMNWRMSIPAQPDDSDVLLTDLVKFAVEADKKLKNTPATALEQLMSLPTVFPSLRMYSDGAIRFWAYQNSPTEAVEWTVTNGAAKLNISGRSPDSDAAWSAMLAAVKGLSRE